MTKKTTKTSHVLNLIANKADTAALDDSISELPKDENIPTPGRINVESIEITADAVTIQSEGVIAAESHQNQATLTSEPQEAKVSSSAPVNNMESILEMGNKEDDHVSGLIKDRLMEEAHEALSIAEEIHIEKILAAEAPALSSEDFEVFPAAASLPEEHSQPQDNTVQKPNAAEIRPYYNIVENIVKNKAILTMTKLGMCTCNKCVNDVVALTLNMLPPKYAVTDQGQLFAKLDAYEKQYAADMLTAIAKSCVRVNKNPRHQ